jgi:hypothetical protein
MSSRGRKQSLLSLYRLLQIALRVKRGCAPVVGTMNSLRYTPWCSASTRIAAQKWPTDTQDFCLRGTGDGNSALSCCPKVNVAYRRMQAAARGTGSQRRTSHTRQSVHSQPDKTTRLEKEFSFGREGWRCLCQETDCASPPPHLESQARPSDSISMILKA